MTSQPPGEKKQPLSAVEIAIIGAVVIFILALVGRRAIEPLVLVAVIAGIAYAMRSGKIGPVTAWWRRQHLGVKVIVMVLGLGIVGNLIESFQQRQVSQPPPPPPQQSAPTPSARSAPTPPPQSAPAPTSNVATLAEYLAEKDKTVAWLVDSAEVEGDELTIVVNGGWYGLTMEQKVALASTLLPAAFIVSREADGIKNHESVVVSIYDTDRNPLAV